jgi:hypothetical protein
VTLVWECRRSPELIEQAIDERIDEQDRLDDQIRHLMHQSDRLEEELDELFMMKRNM